MFGHKAYVQEEYFSANLTCTCCNLVTDCKHFHLQSFFGFSFYFLVFCVLLPFENTINGSCFKGFYEVRETQILKFFRPFSGCIDVIPFQGVMVDFHEFQASNIQLINSIYCIMYNIKLILVPFFSPPVSI